VLTSNEGIKNCFKIITSIGVYYFCAASTEQMNEWITKIKRVLINNNALTTFEKKQIDLAKKVIFYDQQLIVFVGISKIY